MLEKILSMSPLAVRSRLWRANNPERRKEIDRASRKKHWAKRYAELKEWRKKNPERRRAEHARYRAKHKQKIKEWQRQHYLKPHIRSRILEKTKLYWSQRPERRREICRKWCRSHRADGLARSKARRALKKKATVNKAGILQFVRSVKSKKWVTCYYCQSLTPAFGCHFDHIVPLAEGGPHAVENLCVSCPTCNMKKSDYLLINWKKPGQQILPM